jgi:hypothetical protein
MLDDLQLGDFESFESDSRVISTLVVGFISLALHAVDIFGVMVAEPASEFLTITSHKRPFSS